MDEIDRRILDELQRDGRIANIELADRVGLSPSPCLQRVKRLTETGVIRRFTAVIDPAKVDRGLSVTIFADMTSNDPDAVREFEELVLAVDGVTEFRRLFGHPDYIITVATRDLDSYEALYHNEIAAMRTLARLDSHIPMRILRDRSGGF